ncbi:tetratricopeptide repeat protein 27, partial [Trifolium medium]|nr:tetratricopeptide repeat protein 27 [Trifolium medium]
EAIKEFEDLELWDNLIHCYSLLEKKATAVELIRKRLSERPNDPRLWYYFAHLAFGFLN